MIPPRRPSRGRGSRTPPVPPGPTRTGPPPSRLLRTVIAALRHVEAVRGLDEATQHAQARRVDRALRDASEAVPTPRADPGVTAVRVACAHLAAGDLDSARQALVTARELLR